MKSTVKIMFEPDWSSIGSRYEIKVRPGGDCDSPAPGVVFAPLRGIEPYTAAVVVEADKVNAEYLESLIGEVDALTEKQLHAWRNKQALGRVWYDTSKYQFDCADADRLKRLGIRRYIELSGGKVEECHELWPNAGNGLGGPAYDPYDYTQAIIQIGKYVMRGHLNDRTLEVLQCDADLFPGVPVRDHTRLDVVDLHWLRCWLLRRQGLPEPEIPKLVVDVQL